MSRQGLFRLPGFIAAAAVAMSCSQVRDTNSTAGPTAAPSAAASAPPVTSPRISATPVPRSSSQVKSLPPEGGDIPRPGEFKGYSYTYKKDATKTVATFAGKLLPADNNSIYGAVREVIARSYGDNVNSAPRITGSGPSRTMRIASKKYDYVVVVVSDHEGEIRALIITQMEMVASP